MTQKIKVMIMDDSSVVCQPLNDILASEVQIDLITLLLVPFNAV